MGSRACLDVAQTARWFRRGGPAPLASTLSAVLLLTASCPAREDEGYTPDLGPRAGTESRVLSFGVHPVLDPQHTYKVFGPLADYLSRHLPNTRIEVEASSSYEEFERKLARRTLHLARANGYQTLAALGHGYRVFGKMADDGKLRGLILVRKDSGIEEVSDLAGKTVSFPAPTAVAATMLPLQFLRPRGLDTKNGIRCLFTGSHESSIMSVSLGTSAAGATSPLPWEAFAAAHPQRARELLVKWETPALVNHGLLARNDVPGETVDAIASLLFSLQTHEEGRKLLAAVPVSRFEPATEAAYEPVRAFLETYGEAVP